MSTSADPSVAHRFTGSNRIILEVSTKNAIPVGYMSAWGNNEREFIVNKGQKYTVKAIIPDVGYEYETRQGNVRQETATVVQLEAVEG
jgi:hypothetical protein